MNLDSFRRSTNSSDSSAGSDLRRNRNINLWRPSSLVNLVSNTRRQRVLQSFPSMDSLSVDSMSTEGSVFINSDKRSPDSNAKENSKRGWNTIVYVILVEAKGLPASPSDDSGHSLFCKIKLGSETLKTKSVPKSLRPAWRERLKFHLNKDHLLKVSLWDKGSQRNFMGSCVIDLSSLEKERSHEIWQDLDDGYGAVHLNVTMCAIRSLSTSLVENIPNLGDVQEKFALLNLKTDWKVVGQLYVRVVGARGVSGKPSAYCCLEIDNERVQTPTARSSAEPIWNKNYIFNVYDVTSTLDIKVYDKSIVNSLGFDQLGKVSIPLLRIKNGELRWYALKDKYKRNLARGNCPRVLLEMSLVWNPVKATAKLFQPKEVKYIKKPPKFDIGLIYYNLVFVLGIFSALAEANEIYKHLFEWENRELSTVALGVWILFWYNIQLWIIPLLLLIPFIGFWIYERNENYMIFMRSFNSSEGGTHDDDKSEQSVASKIQSMPEITLTIHATIEYIVSMCERVFNLVKFKVPYLSCVVMLGLVFASFALYYVSFNYFMIALGIYKYVRKYLKPDRKLNNDLLDFLSRVPDNEILKDWKEFNVPEPNVQLKSMKNPLARSIPKRSAAQHPSTATQNAEVPLSQFREFKK